MTILPKIIRYILANFRYRAEKSLKVGVYIAYFQLVTGLKKSLKKFVYFISFYVISRSSLGNAFTGCWAPTLNIIKLITFKIFTSWKTRLLLNS